MPGILKLKKFSLVFILAVILAFYVLMIIHLARENIQGDFAIFYGSAQNYYEGNDIYTPIPIEEYGAISPEIKAIFNIETFYPNLNLPFQSLLFLPFPFISIQYAYVIWSFLSIILGLASARMIGNLKSGLEAKSNSFYLIAILLFAFFPSIAAIGEGQITFLMLILLTTAWVFSRARHDRAAGIVLGMALSIKVFVGIFLIYFLFRGRFKLLAWCAGTFLINGLVALSVFGIDAYQHYLSILKHINWYSFSWNASYKGYFTRLFEVFDHKGLVSSPGSMNIAVYTITLLSGLLLFWATRLSKHTEERFQFDLGFSLTLVLMLLISPFGWIYYLPFLIIPIILIILVTNETKSSLIKILAIGAWVAMAIWPLWQCSSTDEFHILLQLGFFTYFLLIFAGMLTWLIFNLRRTGKGPLPASS